MSVVEDNQHVLCQCPAHDAARDVCCRAIAALRPTVRPFAVGNPMLPLSVSNLVSPDVCLDPHPELIPQALAITSQFFKQIAATRPF
jgi:hypothetical protein